MAARRNRQHARARALPKTGDLQAALAQYAAVTDAKQLPWFSNCGRFKVVKPAKFANARAHSPDTRGRVRSPAEIGSKVDLALHFSIVAEGFLILRDLHLIVSRALLILRSALVSLRQSSLMLRRVWFMFSKASLTLGSLRLIVSHAFPILRKDLVIVGRSFLILGNASSIVGQASLILRNASPIVGQAFLMFSKGF
jgi:hypothetical protein